jgi:hypothetical protein
MASINVTQSTSIFGSLVLQVTLNNEHAYISTTISNEIVVNEWINAALSDPNITRYCSVSCNWNEGENHASILQLCIDNRVLIYNLSGGNATPQSLRRFLLCPRFVFVSLRPQHIERLRMPPHGIEVRVSELLLPEEDMNNSISLIFFRHLGIPSTVFRNPQLRWSLIPYDIVT